MYLGIIIVIITVAVHLVVAVFVVVLAALTVIVDGSKCLVLSQVIVISSLIS